MVYLQINIVGIKRLGNLETCTVEDLDVALNGCVRSTFIVCKEAIPELIKTKGAIVNMSSVSGIRAVSVYQAILFINKFIIALSMLSNDMFFFCYW